MIDEGTLTALVLTEIPTVAPLAGAAPEILTVQVVLALADSAVAAHCSDESVALTGAANETVTLCELPFREALITAA